MIEILDTLVSLDLFKTLFCCDLSQCHGICCIEGDAGAPVTIEEVELLEEATETAAVWNELSPEAQQQIDNEGVVYPDREGELVTQIVNGKDCVFTCYHEGKCLCSLERAFRQKRSSFIKPISCALYPIREKKLGNGLTALNYNRWEVCKDARTLGNNLKLPLWKFLKEPLIRRFGEEWYEELSCTVEYLSSKNPDLKG